MSLTESFFFGQARRKMSAHAFVSLYVFLPQFHRLRSDLSRLSTARKQKSSVINSHFTIFQCASRLGEQQHAE